MGRTRMGRTDVRTDERKDGRTDGRTRRRLYAPPKFFGEHKYWTTIPEIASSILSPN